MQSCHDWWTRRHIWGLERHQRTSSLTTYKFGTSILSCVQHVYGVVQKSSVILPVFYFQVWCCVFDVLCFRRPLPRSTEHIACISVWTHTNKLFPCQQITANHWMLNWDVVHVLGFRWLTFLVKETFSLVRRRAAPKKRKSQPAAAFAPQI